MTALRVTKRSKAQAPGAASVLGLTLLTAASSLPMAAPAMAGLTPLAGAAAPKAGMRKTANKTITKRRADPMVRNALKLLKHARNNCDKRTIETFGETARILKQASEFGASTFKVLEGTKNSHGAQAIGLTALTGKQAHDVWMDVFTGHLFKSYPNVEKLREVSFENNAHKSTLETLYKTVASRAEKLGLENNVNHAALGAGNQEYMTTSREFVRLVDVCRQERLRSARMMKSGQFGRKLLKFGSFGTTGSIFRDSHRDLSKVRDVEWRKMLDNEMLLIKQNPKRVMKHADSFDRMQEAFFNADLHLEQGVRVTLANKAMLKAVNYNDSLVSEAAAKTPMSEHEAAWAFSLFGKAVKQKVDKVPKPHRDYLNKFMPASLELDAENPFYVADKAVKFMAAVDPEGTGLRFGQGDANNTAEHLLVANEATFATYVNNLLNEHGADKVKETFESLMKDKPAAVGRRAKLNSSINIEDSTVDNIKWNRFPTAQSLEIAGLLIKNYCQTFFDVITREKRAGPALAGGVTGA